MSRGVRGWSYTRGLSPDKLVAFLLMAGLFLLAVGLLYLP